MVAANTKIRFMNRGHSLLRGLKQPSFNFVTARSQLPPCHERVDEGRGYILSRTAIPLDEVLEYGIRDIRLMQGACVLSSSH